MVVKWAKKQLYNRFLKNEVDTELQTQINRLKKQVFRKRKMELAQDTHFDSASFQVETFENFSPRSLAPNVDWSWIDRKITIPRSRDAYDNDPVGGGLIDSISIKSVGINGLSVKPNIDREVTGLSEEQAKRLEKILMSGYQRWCKKENCDIEGERSFAEICRVIVMTKSVDGDLLVNTVSRKFEEEEFFLKVQLIEGERVSNPFGMPDVFVEETVPIKFQNIEVEPTNALTQGIEHTNLGRHRAYHVREAHPGDTRAHVNVFKWKRIPVHGKSGRRRAFFVKSWGRIDRKRGVPKLARVLEKLRTIKQYSRHELYCSAVQALYTAFIKNINPETDGNFDIGNNAQKAVNPQSVTLGSGTVQYLEDNQDVMFANPTRPNSVYGAFTRDQYTEVGAGTGFPVDYMLKVFNTSYTAARAAFLEAQDTLALERFDLVNDAVEPIYGLLVDELVIVGETEDLVDVDLYFSSPKYRQAIIKASFVGSKLGSIDELRDVQAAGLRVDKGFSTFGKEINQMHGTEDFAAITNTLGEELEVRRQKGIIEVVTPEVTVATEVLNEPEQVEEIEEEQEDQINEQ